MAGSSNLPWSNDEKNYLMAEIIKAASPPTYELYNIIQRKGIQPRWFDIALPPGRSVNACQTAFEEIKRSSGVSTMPQMYGPQTPMNMPPGGKRPYPIETGASFSGREIRPKPTLGPLPGHTPTEPPPKRKRGRPTKAEAQAKAEAAGMSSEPSSASRSLAPPSAPSPAVAASPAGEVKPTLPPITRMPMSVSAMVTPTAEKSASQSSSSSGKRRRGRSLRSEVEELQQGEAAFTGQSYESPYGRIVDPADTPAKTAVMRHREEPGPAYAETRMQPRREAHEPGPT